MLSKRRAFSRRLPADPANRPHQAAVSAGDRNLELDASAPVDKQGEYLGPMAAWRVATERVTMADGEARNGGIERDVAAGRDASDAHHELHADNRGRKIPRNRGTKTKPAGARAGGFFLSPVQGSEMRAA